MHNRSVVYAFTNYSLSACYNMRLSFCDVLTWHCAIRSSSCELIFTILAKHLYAFNMFLFVCIRYIDCCEVCLPCVNDGMHQAISVIRKIKILFTLYSFRYITWSMFVFFVEKPLNFKTRKDIRRLTAANTTFIHGMLK